MTELYTGRSPETLDLLLRRRSSTARGLVAPGPDAEQIQLILTAGVRTPDHGKLTPWRFLIFEGEGRAEFGALLARVVTMREPEAGEVRLQLERQRFLRAPLVIAVISSPKAGKPIPEREQQLSAGAVCQNMMIAATALGFGSLWITEWCAYDEAVTDALGLTAEERVAGFLYLGTRNETLRERERPDLAALVRHWRA
jgi:nitroreductase